MRREHVLEHQARGIEEHLVLLQRPLRDAPVIAVACAIGSGQATVVDGTIELRTR